jgi:uncharacterized membrane protein YfcA
MSATGSPRVKPKGEVMTPLMIAALGLLMVATAFLSGLFGMAGGPILIGVLLALMPLLAAMVPYAITQMASNGRRAVLWRAHISLRPVFVFMMGCAVALAIRSKLGVTPFMVRLTPRGLRPTRGHLAGHPLTARSA